MAAQGPIHLHRSNHTEVLATELVEILRRDPLGPFQEEWIVVQGPGMQRWLSIELARQLGVWAHARFPFPRHLIDAAMRSVLELEDSAASVVQSGPLLWAIAREISLLRDRPDFAEIRHYLDLGEAGKAASEEQRAAQVERKRFQLAARIADIFDRYTIYRPQLLSQWEAGQGEGWQPALWRGLTERHDRRHPGAMLTQFLERVGKSSAVIPELPRRVCLFGISALPPLYMRVLSALAERVELHLFVLSPSREYWVDLRGKKRGEESELVEGNALLASLGRLSGDFQEVLEENAEYQEVGDDLYREPDAGTGMLATLQSDILHLRHRAAGQAERGARNPEPLVIDEQDRSLSIHSCHSPMREVEVMHDQIVAFLEANPSLEAQDVIVMTPDIEGYAPLIDAVFSSESKDRPRIPYQIADRSDRSTFLVMQAFSKILATLSGRMAASEVLDLLSQDAIASRFELQEEDLDQIKSWVSASGIRWGVDAGHRKKVGQPALSENTWQFGLDRLLLGYAMQGGERDLFGGVLPLDAVEGSHTQVLGKFLEFTSALFRFRELVAPPASLTHWSSILSSLLATMVQVDDSNLGEHRMVRDSIDKLVADAAMAGFDEELSFDTVQGLLDESWQRSDSARGFRAGGVTFCQLMPMRSIPFALVCVLGMSDNSFPRSVHPLAFDLMAKTPKMGDRNVRDDDRYLFLEAILSARNALVISYVGRSIRSNALLPPSVLVGELIEVLSDSFSVAGGKVADRVVVEHALQPFSPQYFGRANDPRLFSYSQVYGLGAESLGKAKDASGTFLEAQLPLEEGLQAELGIEQLVRFFTSPSKYILEQRLGLYLREQDDSLQDREPMGLAGLEGYQVGDELLRRLLRGEDASEAFRALCAGGALPLGAVGRVHFEDMHRSITLLSECAQEHRQEEALESLLFDRVLAGTRLTGTIDNLWPQGRVQVAYKRLGRPSELGDWIRHLCLCVVAENSCARTSLLIGRAESKAGMHLVKLSDPGNAEELLSQLVELYWAGQLAPLPFFPQTARFFAKKLGGESLSELDPELYLAAMAATENNFVGSSKHPGESTDPYISQIHQDLSCLSRDYRPFAELPAHFQNFEDSAEMIFAPLLASREHRVL